MAQLSKNLLKDFDFKSCGILSMTKLPMKTCYAVSWNFMFFRSGIFNLSLNLCKNNLTCISIPWLPSEDPEARRLMNEIILDEESGPHPDGGFVSHFELYLDAMNAAGEDRSNTH